MHIYVITNLVTGKTYIGQHKRSNLKQYLQKKFYHSRNQKTGSSYLFNAMRKYPNQDDWSIESLMEADTKIELDRLERLFIGLYDTRNPEVGYNICRGGEGFTGKHTDEWKKNHSAMMKGHPTSLETRAKIIAANTGRKQSAATCARISAVQLGKVTPEETKAKMAVSHIGKKYTPMSDVGRANIAAAQTGIKRKPHSAESKAKRSAVCLKRNAERREERNYRTL